MKKVNITFFFLLIIVNLGAQENKHEVTLGGGAWSSTELLARFADFWGHALTFGGYEANRTHYGTYHFGYKYNISERIGVGSTFAFEKAHSDHLFFKKKQGKYNNTFFTIAPEGDFKYLQKGKITLYLLFGAGITIRNERYSPNNGEKETRKITLFNLQATPVGIKYGNKFGVFGELGVGYKGIVCIGLFGRF